MRDLDRGGKLQSVTIRGVEFRPGSQVRVCPKGNRDIIDLALRGMTGVIESIEQDFEDKIYLAVTFNEDPGQDLGRDGKPGHRFFFFLDEVEPV
jgi:hypothetical protein